MYGKVNLSSALDSELLATAKNNNLKLKSLGQSPAYVEDPNFQDFIEKVQPMINTNTGYMFIALDKEYYEPGQMVRGSIFFELFHFAMQTKLMIKFEG